MCSTHARGFCFSDDFCCSALNRCYTYDKAGNLIQSSDQRSGVLHYVYDKIGRIQEARNSQTGRSETFAFDPFGRRLSKERQDKLAWTSTEPKRPHFVWDGTRLIQEYTYKGCYTDPDSYEPLAQIHNSLLQKVFIEIKHKLRRTINFVRPIGKMCTELY